MVNGRFSVGGTRINISSEAVLESWGLAPEDFSESTVFKSKNLSQTLLLVKSVLFTSVDGAALCYGMCV